MIIIIMIMIIIVVELSSLSYLQHLRVRSSGIMKIILMSDFRDFSVHVTIKHTYSITR